MPMIWAVTTGEATVLALSHEGPGGEPALPGIKLEYIQPGNPQHDAYVERFNRTVPESANRLWDPILNDPLMGAPLNP